MSKFRWLSNVPLIKIKEFHIENGWDVPLLERLVGHKKTTNLYHFLSRQKKGQHVLIWMKENDGSFSTKSAWDYIRVRAPLLP